MAKDNEDRELSEKEIAARRDEVIRRMANTKPAPKPERPKNDSRDGTDERGRSQHRP